MEPKLKNKRWEKSLEKLLLKKWEKEKIYQLEPKVRNIFSIDTPPPYPSGRPWHIGAAAHYSQIDMIARATRMLGKHVYFPLGIDRNGLPVELYTEKKHKIKLHEIPREKFTELCRTSLDDLEAEMIEVMRAMGMSCDFNNYYRTDSEKYRALTQSTFIWLWNKGLIYEDTRPNNYCLDCGTTIADAEVVYEERPTELVYIKFRMPRAGKDLIIATTRPELICSCQAVMVNKDDKRYKGFIGQDVEIPLYKRLVKLIAHPYPNPEFGSGVVMVCSYGDQDDVRHFRELQLQEIIAIDLQGRMTKAAGPYKGLSVHEARKAIVRDLEKKGLVIKKERIAHRTPICERSKTPIEIIPMKEFYLRQTDVKDKVWEISKRIRFYPERHRQILQNWVNSITMDWPISRRRYYATEIPIWYCKACGAPNLPKPGPYYQPWRQDPPFKSCRTCGSRAGFVGESRTFDTWMDSSISPLFITRYQRDKTFFAKTYPAGIRPQGKDIVRTWLYYTILRCYQLTGKPAFERAWISGYCVDERGEKMSKSKGNVIDPVPVLERYGGDSFRFWAASESSLGSDFRASVGRVEVASRFLTKLWNVARFISAFPQPRAKVKLLPLDRWIIREVGSLIKNCLRGYKEYDFFVPANRIRDFVWNLFAPHYLEMAKARAYGMGSKEGQRAALHTLHYVLKTVLELLAPITPFITDHIYRELYSSQGVHVRKFPRPVKITSPGFTTEQLVSLNSRVWKAKKDRGLSLKAEVKEITIPKKLKAIEGDIRLTHNARQIKYGKRTRVLL